MKLSQNIQLWVFSAFISLQQPADTTIDSKSVSACYGVERSNSLQLFCQTGTKIVVKNVYALSKPKSSKCPQQQTTNDIDLSCCKYDENDCKRLYTGEYLDSYYECNDKSSCNKRVSWMESSPTCNTSVYIEKTHYMRIDYYCTPDDTLDPCSDETIAGSTVFLLSSNQYPFQCNCLIEPSCEMEYKITVLIFSQNEDICKQLIVFTYRNSTVRKDCNVMKDTLPALLFDDFESFLSLKFIQNFNVSRRSLLIQIEGSSQKGHVTISCGKSEFSRPMISNNPPVCQIQDTTINANLMNKEQSFINVNTCDSTPKLSCRDPVCLPEWNLNTFFFICPYVGNTTYINQGYCAVFSKLGERVDFREDSLCKTFNGTCPEKPYKAAEIKKYPTCLRIDTENKCYLDDPKCWKLRNVNKGPDPKETSTQKPITNRSTKISARNEWLHALLIIIFLITQHEF